MGTLFARLPQDFTVADHDRQIRGAGDRGVEKGPVQQPGLLDRNDNLPEARALGLVDRDCVGQREIMSPCPLSSTSVPSKSAVTFASPMPVMRPRLPLRRPS